MRELGCTTRAEVWPHYLALVHDGVVPLAAPRREIAELFEYLAGFKNYHYKDIAIAWKYAVKEPYRTYTIRFGIYEHELERYLENVHGFAARLAAYPPGLNPLLAACAEVKVDLALRVWDVMKALRLAREPAGGPEARAGLLAVADETMRELEGHKEELAGLRARVRDAEITARNEETSAAVDALAAKVERTRQALWDRFAGALPKDGHRGGADTRIASLSGAAILSAFPAST